MDVALVVSCTVAVMALLSALYRWNVRRYERGGRGTEVQLMRSSDGRRVKPARRRRGQRAPEPMRRDAGPRDW